MKILYIENKHGGCNYYQDIINYLKKYCDLKIINPLNSLSQCIKQSNFNPDIIIIGFGITDCGEREPMNIIKDVSLPVYIILNKEYAGLKNKLLWINKIKPNKVFTVHHHYNEYEKIVKIPFVRIMWSADETIFKKYNDIYNYDLFFSGVIRKEQTDNWRNKIYDNLNKLQNVNIFMNAKFFINDRLSGNFVNLNNIEYAKKMSESKIVITTTGPADLVGTRYFEIMSSNKSLIICNKMDKKVYENIAIDGFNCVMFSTITEFIDKVNYYLTHEEERMKIVNQAYKYFLEKHTWDHKVNYLLKNL